MTIDEAKNKMDFLKKAYQKLIDEKVDSGKLVGDGVSGEWKAETPLDEAYKDIIEALDMAIKALEQTTWIPVSERLPEEYCLFCDIDGDVYYGHIYDKKWWADGQDDRIKNVTAWMPLPQPYAESEDRKRLCESCEFHMEKGCSKWECVFEGSDKK